MVSERERAVVLSERPKLSENRKVGNDMSLISGGRDQVRRSRRCTVLSKYLVNVQPVRNQLDQCSKYVQRMGF